MTSLREKLVKIGAKVVSHGRYVAFQVAIPRQMFQEILPDRGTTTATATSASMKRSIAIHSTATDGRSTSKCQAK